MFGMNWTVFAAIGIALLLVLNSIATRTALGAKDFLKSQIRNQIFLIWLLPVVGAIVILVYHASSDDEDPRDDGGNSSDMTDQQLIDNVWLGGDR